MKHGMQSHAKWALWTLALAWIATPQVHAAQAVIDATSAETWAYFSLRNGKTVEVADPMASLEWDIAFQRTNVKLNSGVNGPGKAGVLVRETAFESVKVAPAGGYRQDEADALAISGDRGWYLYTGPPLHQILPLERVFILRAADGKTCAKLRVLGYYADNAARTGSGVVTVEYALIPSEDDFTTLVKPAGKAATTWAAFKAR